VIIELPDTTTSQIAKTLVKIREEGGAVALGRVLTLVISTDVGEEEEAIEAANDASREHPMRVIVLSFDATAGDTDAPARVDAQIRVGGDAGASEVIVVRSFGPAAGDQEGLVTGLLLPDAPVVVWWPGTPPDSAAETELGTIGQRRITDAASDPNPLLALDRLRSSYTPGDTDFSWTRLTLWRAQLAAALDQPPFDPVTAIEVHGTADSPSSVLLAAWLQLQLQVPVKLKTHTGAHGSSGIGGVVLERASGTLRLERYEANMARLEQPGQPVHDVSLPRRSLRDCLAEELRRLDPDDLYGEVMMHGIEQLGILSEKAARKSAEAALNRAASR
jgi:glucose-6-phosphate dehydrogenase assembly protein OpcA